MSTVRPGLPGATRECPQSQPSFARYMEYVTTEKKQYGLVSGAMRVGNADSFTFRRLYQFAFNYVANRKL